MISDGHSKRLTIVYSYRRFHAAVMAWIGARVQSADKSRFTMPCLWFAAVMAFGIGLQQCWEASTNFWIIALLVTFSLAILLRFLSRPNWARWLAPIIVIQAAGWHHAQQMRWNDREPLLRLGTDTWEPVVFEAIIDGVPRWRPDLMTFRKEVKPDKDAPRSTWQTILDVRTTQVRDRSTWKPINGKLIVNVEGPVRHLLPGDRVRVYGKWQRIPTPSNPGQFDMAAFYAMRGQSLRARTETSDQVEKLGVANYWRIDRWLAALMERGDNAMHRYVGRYQARLASALILGQREQVEWELQESLLATGTMHMLAISGMHVEMIALSVVAFALLVHVPRKSMLILISVIVIAYSILCGWQPPVVRAAILVVATCIGRWFGKSSNALNILGLAAIFLMVQRSTVVLDVGAQLSFLAVATLIVTAGIGKPSDIDPLDQVIFQSRPKWQQHLIQLAQFSWLILKTSGWVWLLTAPMILVRFHVFAPVSILLNLILWVPLFGALLSGMGLLVLGTWLPPFGYLFGAICTVCLWFVQQAITLGEWMPGGHVWLPAASMEWMVGFYLSALVMWCFGFFKEKRRKGFAIILGIWLAMGIVPLYFGPNGKWPLRAKPTGLPLRVTFIDVGHGTSVLIQTPSNQTWLYDAGRMGDMERSYMAIASVLWYEGLARVDDVFLSHADSDHYNALVGISKRFSMTDLTTTPQVIHHPDPMMQGVLQTLNNRGVRTRIWQQGTEVTVDGVRIRAIHPPAQGVPGSDNANSLCLMIDYAGRTVFLPGDLETTGTELVISQPPQRVDVMMAPHHGS